MKRLGFWPLLLVLSACASGPKGDSPQAICQRQAYDDPRVKELTLDSIRATPMSPKAQFDYDQAVRNAVQACLLKHGVAVQGGVESVRPSY